MSEQQLAQSASLLDNSGQQLLPNTRGELVWVKLASSRVVSSYSPEFEPTPSATNGTAHLSWVLARTPRLDLANTFDIFDIKLKSGNSVLPIASMTAEGGLTFGSSDSPIAAIKRYVSSTDKTYVDGNEIFMIDASGIHSQRGVSAKGICDLTIAGGGGGRGTVTAVRLATGSTPINPDADGIITLSVYSISQIGTLLEGKADASRVADIEALIPEDTDTDNPLVNVAGMTEAIQSLPKPMIFKGSLGTGGTITSLPSASKNVEGFTYKVITAGTYSGFEAKVGDTFICAQKTSSTYEWVLIPSGDEPSGTVTSVGMAAGTGLEVSRETGQSGPITTSGTFTIGIASGYKLPSTAEWDGKQDTLPTSGDPISTYAINISGNAATLENHGADYFATAEQIELASVALQSLQSQIDSVASRNHFDELIVTSLFVDMLVGTLHGNADTATKLATQRIITIGDKSNAFDGSENISFTLDDIGAKKLQQAVEKTSTSIKTLTKITQNANGEISATFEDIPPAADGQKGLIALGYAATDTNHLHAPLNIDTNGKGYALSQMGYKANDVVFEPTPNFA